MLARCSVWNDCRRPRRRARQLAPASSARRGTRDGGAERRTRDGGAERRTREGGVGRRTREGRGGAHVEVAAEQLFFNRLEHQLRRAPLRAALARRLSPSRRLAHGDLMQLCGPPPHPPPPPPPYCCPYPCPYCTLPLLTTAKPLSEEGAEVQLGRGTQPLRGSWEPARARAGAGPFARNGRVGCRPRGPPTCPPLAALRARRRRRARA